MKRFMKKIFAGVTVALMFISSAGISNQLVNAEEMQQEQDTIEQVEVNQTEAGAEFIDQEVIADEVENEENLGIIASGVDGGVTWSIDDEGLLVVNITGDLSYDPVWDGGSGMYWPWHGYEKSITEARIQGSGITHLQYMFCECANVVNIDLSNLDTSKVTSMTSMFIGCSSMLNIDLSNFNTEKVEYMDELFMNCSSLTNIDLSSFDTSNTCNFAYMFKGCDSIKCINVSSFDMSSNSYWCSYGDPDIFGLRDCNNLEIIYTPKVILDEEMVLPGQCLYKNKAGEYRIEITDASDIYTIVKEGTGQNGGVRWSLDSKGYLKVTVSGDLNVTEKTYEWPWKRLSKYIEKAKVKGTGMTWTYSMFSSCYNLKSIDMSEFDTSKVTDMSWMFSSCSSLTEVDFSNCDLSKVYWHDTGYPSTSCSGTRDMFYGCNGLISIKTPSKLPNDEIIPCDNFWGTEERNIIVLFGKYLNKSGKERTEILDTNDIYTRWDVPVTGVKLNKTSLKLNVGDTTALKATIFPSDASLKTLKWSSSNKKVATVDSNGKVKALAKGTATITVTTVDGSKKATCKMTVTEKKIDPDKPTVKTITMYRLYNPNSGEHFYSSSQSEIDTIVAAGWKNEGFAWKAPKTSKTPVYRLYNPNAGDHHYTTSAAEKESLKKAGWKYEGIGWYSDDNKGVPLHRLYNPNATTGSHHYTTSATEKDNLVKAGWKYEGIAWYGIK